MSGTLKVGDIIAYGALHKYFRDHVLNRKYLAGHGNYKREDNIKRGQAERHGRKIYTSFGYNEFGENGVNPCRANMYEFPTGVVAGNSGQRISIGNVDFNQSGGWGRNTADDLWYLWTDWNNSGFPFQPTGYHVPKGWRVDKCNSRPSSHRMNIDIIDNRSTFRFKALPVSSKPEYNEAEVSSDEHSKFEFSELVLLDNVKTGFINSATNIDRVIKFRVGTTVTEQVVNSRNTDVYDIKTKTKEKDLRFTQGVKLKAGADVGPVKYEGEVSAGFEQGLKDSQSFQTGTITSVGFSESKTYEVREDREDEIRIVVTGANATPSDESLDTATLVMGEEYDITLWRQNTTTSTPVYSNFTMSGGTTTVIDRSANNRPLMREIPTMEIITHAKNHWADSNLDTNTNDLKPIYNRGRLSGYEYTGKAILSNNLNHSTSIRYHLVADDTDQNSSSSRNSTSSARDGGHLSNDLDFRKSHDASAFVGGVSGLSIDLKDFDKADYDNETVYGSAGQDLVSVIPSKKPIVFDDFISSSFEGSEGDDKIDLGSKTSSNYISTKSGNDKVKVSTDQKLVSLGEGNDILEINSGKFPNIILGNGSDIVKLDGKNMYFKVNDFNPIYDSFRISETLKNEGVEASLKVARGDDKHLVNSYIEFKSNDEIIGEAHLDLSDVSLSNLFDKNYLKTFSFLNSKYNALDFGDVNKYASSINIDSWDLFERVFLDGKLLYKSKAMIEDWSELNLSEKRELTQKAMRDVQPGELMTSSRKDYMQVTEKLNSFDDKKISDSLASNVSNRQYNQYIKTHSINDPDAFIEGFEALTFNSYADLV